VLSAGHKATRHSGSDFEAPEDEEKRNGEDRAVSVSFGLDLPVTDRWAARQLFGHLSQSSAL
jgi:hypothetical protein